MMAQALAPTGALMTFIALWTGAFWGRPTWGTYWAWDARMTSELILLFLYFGVIALRNAIDDPRRADRACAVLTHRRRGERADHLFLGAVVEHAAPGLVGEPHRGTDDGGDHARRACCVMTLRRVVLRDRRRAGARARDHPRARARRRVDRREMLARRMMEFLAMGGYGFYVWSAYGVTALAIVARDRERARAAARGARRAASQHGGESP